GNHTREANLFLAFVNPEAKRVFDSLFDKAPGNPCGPVGFFCKKPVDQSVVELFLVRADGESAASLLHLLGGWIKFDGGVWAREEPAPWRFLPYSSARKAYRSSTGPHRNFSRRLVKSGISHRGQNYNLPAF